MYHIKIIRTITKPSQFTLKTVSILYQQRETGQILLSGRTFLRRVKLLQDQQALLGGISPENGTEGLHRLFALAVVGGKTDVLHMAIRLKRLGLLKKDYLQNPYALADVEKEDDD